MIFERRSMRKIYAVLANLDHKLPVPNTKRFFLQEGEYIDADEAFWHYCLNDGSLVEGKEASQNVAAPSVSHTE